MVLMRPRSTGRGDLRNWPRTSKGGLCLVGAGTSEGTRMLVREVQKVGTVANSQVQPRAVAGVVGRNLCSLFLPCRVSLAAPLLEARRSRRLCPVSDHVNLPIFRCFGCTGSSVSLGPKQIYFPRPSPSLTERTLKDQLRTERS